MHRYTMYGIIIVANDSFTGVICYDDIRYFTDYFSGPRTANGQQLLN